jgi:predicted DNA-binding transcriptional regulator YafY
MAGMKKSRVHARTMRRIFYIDWLIREGKMRSAAEAAKEKDLEVSRRTIERDLALLRYSFKAPLKYDRRERRWFYTEKTFRLPAILMTEGELIAIFLAERLIRQYRGAPFERHLKTAFDKIIRALPESVLVEFSPYTEAHSFEIGPITEIDPRVFEVLSRAAINRTTVEITYYTQSRGKQTRRRIDPYLVHNYRGDWYVIAYDHMRRAIRDFHLGRIRSLNQTEDRFRIRSDFDKKSYLESGFSMVRGRRRYLVEIEFDSYQARWIRERNKWHESEEREELPGGGLLLRMKLGGLDALKRFVLQYGSHALVRRPALLRRMVEKEVLKMLSNYDKGRGRLLAPSAASKSKSSLKRRDACD